MTLPADPPGMPPIPTPPSRARAGRLAAITILTASIGLSACATGARPSAGPRETDVVVATTAAPAAAPSSSAAVATTSPAPVTTLAPSGDPSLDQMDADLSVFEKESAGLDHVAAASQETKP